MNYHFSFSNPNSHYITIKATFSCEEANAQIYLPNWRPGRYQIQNFAKRIKSIKAFDQTSNEISLEKTTKSSWQLGNIAGSVTIVYAYYAFEMDAGNTWVDDEQLYVNFINCCIYTDTSLDKPCTISFDLPNDYQIACGLDKKQHHGYEAPNYYQLVDSPLFASATLRRVSYTVDKYQFNIWVQGELPKTDEELIHDFKRFTALQIHVMGSFPCPEYHFLLQCLPYKHYHGVEHWNSTVITIGPSNELGQRSGYKNLLGVSSHELFHTWNVIRLRPKEMTPYNFQTENYHSTGFITEGITTYYGDLFLAQSGVFTFNEYLEELNKLLKRHYENEGRSGHSVAESSFDLWLDGYEKGIPGRKVSIYNEGALAALILDLMIRVKFVNKKSLDDVMRLMWTSFGEHQTGYTFEDYRITAETLYEASLDEYFENIIAGNEPFEHYLTELFPKFGLGFTLSPSEKIEERFYGFRLNQQTITDIESNSPAYELLSIGDRIESINGVDFNEASLNSESIHVQVNRFGRQLEISLEASENSHFSVYQVARTENLRTSESDMLTSWLGSCI